MKQICLTFDWELFFKESGSIENCQILPTQKLLDIAQKLSIPLVFFVDIMQIWRFQEVEDQSFYTKLCNQIQDMVRGGHQVELHLHPHWLDAEYTGGGKWFFPHYQRYRLENLSEQEVENLFVEGKKSLERICQEVNPNYQVSAFRAGGWCIQPFAPKIQKAMEKTQIFIDSSVVPGMRGYSEAHIFDFSSAPTMLDSWHFSNDPCQNDPEGLFKQIPISSYQKTFVQKLTDKICAKMNYQPQFGDGRGIPLSQNINSKFTAQQSIITLETQNPRAMISQIQKHPHEKLVLLSHPKGMSQKSIDLIQQLHTLGHSFIPLK